MIGIRAGLAVTIGPVIAIWVGCASAQSNESARIARVEHGLLPTVAVRGQRDTAYALADRMQRYRVPGVCIAVIDGGRLAWARAYGVTEVGGAQPVDTTTLFQAGSISKAITSVAALRFVDRGRVGLDEDVNQRLRSWKVPDTALTGSRPVTLRGLLSHGAGLNVPSFPGYVRGTRIPTILQVLEGTAPSNTPPVRVEIAPGSEWRYSGGGLTVVQQLLSDVSRRSFDDVVRDEVFRPAGMTQSTTEQPLPASRAPHAATGHSAGRAIEGRWRVYPEIAAAGIWSTAPDLARFGLAVGGAVRGNGLLKPATAQDMVTRQIGGWGLGFALEGSGDSMVVSHDGSTSGFTARVLVLPATGQGIAVMTNGESEALISEIMRAVAHEYGWPVRRRIEKTVGAVDPAGYAELVGQYRVTLGERTFDFTVSTSGEGPRRTLLITGPGGQPGELLPISPFRFFSRDTGNEFTFVREGNQIPMMLLDQQGQRFEARRMP